MSQFLKKYFLLFIFQGLSVALYSIDVPLTIIERYQSERDQHCLKTILSDFAYQLLKNGTIEEQEYAFKSLEAAYRSTYVMRADEKTVGFINYYITYSPKQNKPYGVINGIGVLKENHQHGYGMQLLNFIFQKLKEREIPSVVLFVKKDNLPAIKLYLKAGFKPYASLEKDFIFEKIFDVEQTKDQNIVSIVSAADNDCSGI